MDNNHKLLGHLLNSISKDVLGQVATLSTSTEVWASLQTSIVAYSRSCAGNELRLQLTSLKKGDIKMAD
jgi:hypothetical protein